jgi:tetratricopeptide (TPR) repeat protein
MGFTGAAYNLCGRLAEGMPLLEQAGERTVAAGRKVHEALGVTRVGEAALLAGRLEAAHTHAVQALTLARERQERGHQAYALRLLGEIAARHSPPEAEQAEAHYRQALALAEAQGMRPLQAHCHRGLGILYAATGQREQVRAELSAAVDLYHAMEMTFWLPEAEVALAQVEGR